MKFVFALAGAVWVLAGVQSADADPIDTVVIRAMTQAHIAGASVAIVRNGKTVSLRSYGVASLEYGARVGPATPFEIASSGKIYTTALLMRLVEEGRLRLDDPVTTYLPDAPAAWKAITVANLASHTSGLGPVEIAPDSVTTLEAVHQAYAATIEAAPGVQASYASVDYTILQYILEKAGGSSYPDLLRKQVLAPLGLTCTTFDMAESRGPQRVAHTIAGRADYYRWTGVANERRWFLYPRFDYAAGGVYSCAADMAKLVAALDRGTFLSAGSRALIENPARLADGSAGQFSIGLATGRYRGHRWIGHSGGPALSDVMYFPDDRLGIIVFANQQRLSPQLASLVADQVFGPSPVTPSVPVPDAHPAWTANVRRLVEGAATGKLDGRLIAAARRDAYVDDLNDSGPAWFGLSGTLSRIELLSDSANDQDGRDRRYRFLYGRHEICLYVAFDRTGLIEGIGSNGC